MSKTSLWIDKLHVSYIQLRNIEQEQNRIVVQFGHNEESIQGKKFSYMEKCHLAVNRQIILVHNEYSIIVLWQTMYSMCGKLTTTDTGRWFGANHAHVFVYWFTIPVMLQPPIPVNPKKISINALKMSNTNVCFCSDTAGLSQNLTPLLKR